MSYDWLNRLTNMVDASGTTKFTWTAGNQLYTEDGPFSSATLTNVYFNRMRTNMALQQPTSFWTNKFVWDAARRLTNVVSPAGSFAYTLAATAAGSPRIKKLALPNSSNITNSYDSVARLASTYMRNSSGTALDSYVYVYDPANEPTNLTRTDGSAVAFTYDFIGQLKVADSSVNSEDRGYKYDAAWNLNTRTNDGVTSTFSVDSKNQLTGSPDGQEGYDGNGNRTTTSAPTLYSLSYDDENRLTSASSSTSWRSDFLYDGLSRLRKRTDYSWNGSSWIASGGAQYIYDGNRVVQERTTSGTPTVAYTRGSDLSGSLESAGGIGGLLSRSSGYSSGNFSTHCFYFADGNGNITYLVDNSQTLAASYRYDP